MFTVINNQLKKINKLFVVNDNGKLSQIKKMFLVDDEQKLCSIKLDNWKWDVIVHEGTNKHNSYSTSWTVPSGVTSVDICCVGGKGGNGVAIYNAVYRSPYFRCSYTDPAFGGFGYYNSVFNVSVVPNSTLTITCGGLGTDLTKSTSTVISMDREYEHDSISSEPTAGGTTTVKYSSTTLCSANGGMPADYSNGRYFHISGSTIYNNLPNNLPKGGNGGIGGFPCSSAYNQTYFASTEEMTNAVMYSASITSSEPNGYMIIDNEVSRYSSNTWNDDDLDDSIFAPINSTGQEDIRPFGDDIIPGIQLSETGVVYIRWKE